MGSNRDIGAANGNSDTDVATTTETHGIDGHARWRTADDKSRQAPSGRQPSTTIPDEQSADDAPSPGAGLRDSGDKGGVS